MNWHPINSAPKDGTPVLAFMPTYYQGRGGQHVVVWMNFTDRPGWYSHVSGIHEPTHWMPLPPPPVDPYDCSHPGCACEDGRCLADEANARFAAKSLEGERS